ncbi:MAG: YbjN domain-containing protein [Alphaproteobacteria bacterium]
MGYRNDPDGIIMAPRQQTSASDIAVGLAHPIDLVTNFVTRHEWQLRERERDALLAEVPGRWSDYQLAVIWRDDAETMQVTCRIDVHADEAQLGELALLAALLNQDIHIGHLALDLNACELELRHTLALRGAGGATPEQIEDVVDIMLGECEHVYPAIYQLVHGEVGAAEAAMAVMMQTEGEA